MPKVSRRTLILFVFLLASVRSGGAAAPTGETQLAAGPDSEPMTPYVPPDYLRQPPTVPPGRKAPRRITLGEAIETALRNNLDIAIQRETERGQGSSRLLLRVRGNLW